MGAVPQVLATPENFQKLTSQYLRFGEMVKLTRMGETPIKVNGVCRNHVVEITLRHMGNVFVVGKNLILGPDPREGFRVGEPSESLGTKCNVIN